MQVLIIVNFDTEEVFVKEMINTSITEALQKTPDNGAGYIFDINEKTLEELKTLDFNSINTKIGSIPCEQEIASICNIKYE